MLDEVVLTEASRPQRVDASLDQLLVLQQLGVCDVIAGDLPGEWLVARVRRVGVVRVGDLQVRIDPKVSIQELLVLLGFEDRSVAWRMDEVSADSAPSVTDALVRAYTRALARATEQGLLRSYREHEESGHVVRGRWDVARQIASRQGALLPVELTVDEFDVDTPPNRLLLSAALRLLRLDGVTPSAARALRSLLPRFDGVSPLRAGVPLPNWLPTRTEVRLIPAVRLARLVLTNRGVTNRSGSHSGVGFLVTMSSLFEDFIERSLAASAMNRGLQIVPQLRGWLDDAHEVLVRPDIVVRRAGEVVAVADAKYKVEQPSGYPNADVYQAIAYAQHHGLRAAHLLYAKGEVEEQRIVVSSAGVTVHRWAIDLELSREGLLLQMDRILLAMTRNTALASTA